MKFFSPTRGLFLQLLLSVALLIFAPIACAQPASDFLAYSDGNGGVAIEGYTGTVTAVVIPAIIDGLPVTTLDGTFDYNRTVTSVTIPNSVTTIGDTTFDNCTNLTSVTIPNSVITIGTQAFYNCTALTSIILPDSVTSIGNEAFSSCTRLTSVTIPPSVNSLGYESFYDCAELTSVNVPAGVISIGYSPFGNCAQLTAITVDLGNPNYTNTTDGILLSKDQTLLINYPAGKSNTIYVIPSSVTSVGEDAFSGCASLVNVAIPNSVSILETEAFLSCTGLVSINIPDGMTTIGNSAFYSCGLTSITIAGSVTNLGQASFAECNSLDSVTILNGVSMIGSAAFLGCGLTSINIPASVTSIGNGAFDACPISSAVFAGNAPTMGGNVFAEAAQNFTVEFYSGAAGFTTPTWTPDDQDSYPCTMLPFPFQYTISNNQVTITGYSGPSFVVIPATINGLPVVSIGDEAFASANIFSVIIPDGVTNIGTGAFYSCLGLSNVTIPPSVTVIASAAFENCPSLLDVFFDGNAPAAGYYAFDTNRVTVKFYHGALGFTPPFWTPYNSYPSVDLGVMPYTTWITIYSGLTNTATNAMPFNDGIPNALKFLFHIDPSRAMTAGDRAALPVTGLVDSGGQSYLTLTFGQSNIANTVSVGIQASTDLVNWTNLASTSANPTAGQYTEAATGADDPSGDPFMQIKVPVNGTKQFIRLHVVSP